MIAKNTYDVALSFAGEDREYVERVATILRDAGVRVFYDDFVKAELWGKDLYSHLRDVYQERASYTVIFVSEHYARKQWTNHERESAQARAFIEHREYILPARFDETCIPGLLPTTGYIDLRNTGPGELASLVVQKLRGSSSEVSKWSNPQQAFIMHAARRGSLNLEYTVTRRRRIREVVDALPKTSAEYEYFSQNPSLHNAFPTGEFNCWGLPRGALPSFKRTNVGDLVVFVGALNENAAIRQIAVVKVKCPIDCPHASRILWPDADEGKTYPLLFFFDTEIGHRDWHAFTMDINRPGYNPRGWYKQIGNDYFVDFGGPAGYLRFLRHDYGFVPLVQA